MCVQYCLFVILHLVSFENSLMFLFIKVIKHNNDSDKAQWWFWFVCFFFYSRNIALKRHLNAEFVLVTSTHSALIKIYPSKILPLEFWVCYSYSNIDWYVRVRNPWLSFIGNLELIMRNFVNSVCLLDTFTGFLLKHKAPCVRNFSLV